MSYELMQIDSVVTSVDRESGEQRITANVKEVNPKHWRINLARKTADVINQITKLQGNTVMLPVETGVFDGRPFMRLLDEPIVYVSANEDINTHNEATIHPNKPDSDTSLETPKKEKKSLPFSTSTSTK